MATVIERPDTTRVVEDRSIYRASDNSGWAIALIVLVVLALIALFAWPGLARRSAAPAGTGSVQVNAPQASTPSPAAPAAPAQY